MGFKQHELSSKSNFICLFHYNSSKYIFFKRDHYLNFVQPSPQQFECCYHTNQPFFFLFETIVRISDGQWFWLTG